METNKKIHEKLGELLRTDFIESEILPRLPIKSIGRCMCVCKQWKSFLSTPMFVDMHCQYYVAAINDYKVLVLLKGNFYTLDDGGLLRPLNLTAYATTMPDTWSACVDFIIGSVDGLVCLAGRSSPFTKHNIFFTFDDGGRKPELAFWNPWTGAYKKLSPNPFFVGYYNKSDVFGFYIDDYSNDYKLVHLRVESNYSGAYIYSHKLDSWRKIIFPFQFKSSIWSEATLCGRCLYFTVSVRPTSDDQGVSFVIICFDVKTEEFREIGLPHVPGPAPFYNASASLVILEGCIHLCVSYTERYRDVGHMWRMNRDGDGWVHAAFSDPICSFIEYKRKRGICTVSTDNWLAVLEEGRNSFKRMNTEDFKTHYGCFCSANWEYRTSRIIYAETLVSP